MANLLLMGFLQLVKGISCNKLKQGQRFLVKQPYNLLGFICFERFLRICCKEVTEVNGHGRFAQA